MQVWELGGRVAERSELGLEAQGAERGLDDALEGEEVGRAASRRPALGLQRTRDHDPESLRLVREDGAGLGRVCRRRDDLVVPQVDLAELEDAGRVVETRQVVAHRAQEARQQHRAHH